jgi:hypothetical protein
MTTRLRLTYGALLALALNTLQGQTLVGLRTQSKDVDFRAATATAPFKTGAILPSTCQTGEAFFKTDVAVGQNLYGCVATNTWAVQSSGGGSALPLNDFQAAVNGQMLTIAEGRAHWELRPVVIATMVISLPERQREGVSTAPITWSATCRRASRRAHPGR